MAKKLYFFSILLLLLLPTLVFAQRGTGRRGGNTTFDLVVQTNIKGCEVRVTGNGANENGWDGSTFTLSSGTYSVQVSSPGYNTETVEVNLTQNRTITVNLSPITYSLGVRSNTPGARVRITGNGANQSGNANNYNATLGQGTYTVTVEADGYETETQQVNLTRNETVTMNLRPSTGTVTIIIAGSAINPKETNARSMIQVYDNGTLLTGEFTWQLRPGQHTIQIVSGGLMAQTTINVRAGQTYTLEPNFSINVR